MTYMRNTSKSAYPKRNGVAAPKPKYGGKALWGMTDQRIKCLMCTRYASHEAVIKREPNPFDTSTEMTVPYCMTHANKAVASNVLVSVKPYDEYSVHIREVNRWQKSQGSELQEVLL